MTQNRRIFFNVVATYGRSVYAIVVGLFTGRWALMALGEVDYGLAGVVAGLMLFVGFLNALLAGAIIRFYAFYVGEAQIAKSYDEGLEECRRWFSLAIVIHTLLPLMLVVAGYPVGKWAICSFLNIPPDRITACVWGWRFTCVNGMIGMITVPFVAMYGAKQELFEQTIYSLVSTTLNFIVLGYMANHPGCWLVRYMLWMCVLSAVPQLVLSVRACIKYDECRFRIKYVFDGERLKKLLLFAGARSMSTLSSLLCNQGLMVAVNKCLGPSKNAAMTIGNTISAQATTLAAALNGAFSPAITNAAGAGDIHRMHNLMLCTSRFATLGVLFFGIPLILEMNEVVHLWLKVPPDGVVVLASLFLVNLAIEKIADGYTIGIIATGKIARCQAWEGLCFVLRFTIGVFLIRLGFDLASVGIGFVVSSVFITMIKSILGQQLCGLRIDRWFREVLLPITIVTICTFSIGIFPSFLLDQSLFRVIITAIITSCIFAYTAWRFAFLAEEKQLVLKKIRFKNRSSNGET